MTITRPPRYAARVSSRMDAKSSEGSLDIYGEIGSDWFMEGITPSSISAALAAIGAVKTLHVNISSAGGDVFEAVAIQSILTRFAAKKLVHVDGLCASAATIVALAGEQITMSANGRWMIHNPLGRAQGYAADLRKTADLMDGVRDTMIAMYARRTARDAKEIGKWMDAETWMSAAEAKERGFTDETTDVVSSIDVAASSLLDLYLHTPQDLRNSADTSDTASILSDLNALAKTRNIRARLAERTKQNEAVASGGKRP